ncbi:trimeric intracellular cation channel family protein [Salirhabdus salicampi]|uniref:trimeric intracellular cation channel family protein n=1 Tax=Salirhabdus salicampi TaxID=476102 RepID=UPI0020C57B33|nr:trimeric intracellular cation channel family protein [Salirhabdus salicampi]MCP8616191.1 trimeric intracellular cation channel family protein [Salirhabdus salicampi]
MIWDILTVIGTIAFGLSGALVARDPECDYDLLGIYTLGFCCAFGGGAIRNLLVGNPISQLWEQGSLFFIAFISITILIIFPAHLIKHWSKWGNFFDAIGLSAFAIQGALLVKEMGYPVSAIVVAAILTGTGGGVLRDLLARRQPLIFRDEIYALWALVAGLLIGLNIIQTDIGLYGLFASIVVLRLISLKYNWRLPRSSYLQREQMMESKGDQRFL